MILRVDRNILLLQVVSTKALGKLENPKWPQSHEWPLVLAARWELSWGYWPGASICFYLVFCMWVVGLPHSLVFEFHEEEVQKNTNAQALFKLLFAPHLLISLWPKLRHRAKLSENESDLCINLNSGRHDSLGLPNNSLPHIPY